MSSNIGGKYDKLGPKEFILWNKKKKQFYITQESKDFFRKFHECVGCIGVAGPMRKGKSFVMNRLNGRGVQGFELGRSVNPCTEGAWFWILDPNLLTLARAKQMKEEGVCTQNEEKKSEEKTQIVSSEEIVLNERITKLRSQVTNGGVSGRKATFELQIAESELEKIKLKNRRTSSKVKSSTPRQRRRKSVFENTKDISNTQFESDGKPFRVILLDFEGMFDPKRGVKKYDTGLFTIACLLSSYLIYNTMSVIDAKDFNQLRMMAEVVKNLQSKSNSKSKKELAKYFPKLLWILRDFMLEMTDVNGNPINEKEYLETRWEIHEPSVHEQSENDDDTDSSGSDSDDDDDSEYEDPFLTPSNSKRKELELQRAKELYTGANLMKKLFPQRDLLTMPCPVDEPEQLRNLDSMEYSRLKESFRDAADRLVMKVYGEVQPKFLFDAHGNASIARGPEFLAYAEQVIEAINSDTSLVFDDCFTEIMKLSCIKSSEMALRECRDRIKCLQKRIAEGKPIQKNEIENLKSQMRHKTENIFEEHATHGRYSDEQKGIVQEKISTLLSSLEADNINLSEKLCRKCIDELCDEITGTISEYAEKDDFEEFKKISITQFQKMKLPTYAGLGPWRDSPLCESFVREKLSLIHASANAKFIVVRNRKAAEKKKLEIEAEKRREEKAQRERNDAEMKERDDREKDEQRVKLMRNSFNSGMQKLKSDENQKINKTRTDAAADRQRRTSQIQSTFNKKSTDAVESHGQKLKRIEDYWKGRIDQAKRNHQHNLSRIR